MVKQQKVLRDGCGPSKVPAAAAGISVSGRSKKYGLSKRSTRLQVLRMLSQKDTEVETEGEPGGSSGKGGTNNGAVTPGTYANGEGSKEFLSTGRTGRRNAMPDILGHHAQTGTADLATCLEALTTTDSKHDQPGTSGVGQSEVSSLQNQQHQHTG